MLETIKQSMKSKTIRFALLLAVFGVLEANLSALQPVLSPTVFGYFSVFIGVVVAVLRVLTTTPLSDK